MVVHHDHIYSPIKIAILCVHDIFRSILVPCWWQDKQRRADELNAQLAEMKQQLHSAARWKTGVAPPQAASRMEEWDLFHDFAYGPKTA